MQAQGSENLPGVVHDYIASVIRKMGYRKKVRADVRAELIAHFEDALKDCETDEQRTAKAQDLITDFGDIKTLAKLIRRGKKRCRPLWQKAIIHSFQVIGILILLVIARVAYLSIGSPNISVDYVQWLNELVKDSKDESLNAKPYYEKAIEIGSKELPEILKELAHSSWPDEISNEQKEAVVKFLEENAESLELIRTGAQKPYYWSEYAGSPQELKTKPYYLAGKIIEGVMPASSYKQIARKLTLSINWKVYCGDAKGALDDCLALQKIAIHTQGKGLLIEQLVGIAIGAMAHDRIFSVLEKLDVSADMLKELQKKLVISYNKSRDVINMEAEKVFWYDIIQRTFTDDGKGGGRMLIRGMPLAVSDLKSALRGFILFDYPDRQEVIKNIDRHFEKADELFTKAPWQWKNTDAESQVVDSHSSLGLFAGILGPAYDKINRLNWRLKTSRDALLTVLAVKRYNLGKGQYPDSLNELLEMGFLKSLPMDPYSDKPLIYKKVDDDFILYSVGQNFQDDDGQPGLDNKGNQKQKWADTGDTIFWSISKN